MKKNKTTDKPIFKKYWFWVAVVVVLGTIGIIMDGGDANTPTDINNSGNSSQMKNNGNDTQNIGTLPALNETDFKGKEGLVVFKDLIGRGYTVTVEFVNEAAPAVNRDLTETFTSSDVNNPEDRQAFDAWVVKDMSQDGDTIYLTIN